MAFARGNTLALTHGLKKGHDKSRGKKNRAYIHGAATRKGMTGAYRTWQAMKQRCRDSHSINYRYYGGRGIKIDRNWLESFGSFLEDMGNRPQGKTLDRINPDFGYYKENCRWATRKEQINNRRKK